MMQYSAEEYLFNELQEMKPWRGRALKAEKELEKVRTSTTMKAGEALLYVPKKIKKSFKK